VRKTDARLKQERKAYAAARIITFMMPSCISQR
jgi:hypothetical protein